MDDPTLNIIKFVKNLIETKHSKFLETFLFVQKKNRKKQRKTGYKKFLKKLEKVIKETTQLW